MATVKEQLDRSQELTAEKAELERRLSDSKEQCNDLTDKLQSAEKEISALRQNVQDKKADLQEMQKEVAENEHLKEKLEANTSIVMNNDEMVSTGDFHMQICPFIVNPHICAPPFR